MLGGSSNENVFGFVGEVMHGPFDKPSAQKVRVGDQVCDREGVGGVRVVGVDSSCIEGVIEELAADVRVAHALPRTVLVDVHVLHVVFVGVGDVAVP